MSRGYDMICEYLGLSEDLISLQGSRDSETIDEICFQRHVKRLESVRFEGNEMFAKHDWIAAAEKYSTCISLCDMFPDHNSDQILMLAHSNMAETRLRLQDFEGALTDADRALQIEPRNVKNLVRRGKAAHGLGLFEKACEAFKCALQESQGQPTILKLLRESSVAYNQSRTGYDRGGRGLFATKSLEPGELLLVSNPLAVLRAQGTPMEPPFSEGRVLQKLIVDLGEGISKSRRQRAMLHCLGSDHDIPSMEMFRPGSDWMPPGREKLEGLDKNLIGDIARKKRFEYLEIEGPNNRGSFIEVTGLWILPAFAKHSCAPNCQHSFVGDTIFFRASGHIMEGEQLTVPYFNDALHDNVAARQARSETWMFKCKCERCIFEESLQPQLSDLSKLFQPAMDRPRFFGRSVHEEMAKAADIVEAAIPSLVSVLLPKQQGWIRATFSAFYVARFEIRAIDGSEPQYDSAARIESLRLAVESMVSVYLIPRVLPIAAVLLSDVESSSSNCVEHYQDYRELKDRVFGIYTLAFGKQPKNVLLSLIKARYSM